MNKNYIKNGLTHQEVNDRINNGLININNDSHTRTVKDIFIANIFNLFNILNFFLALLVMFAGNYRNMLFIGIVIINSLTGIYQEVKAKKQIDKLKLLSNPKARVIRYGEEFDVDNSSLVIDDLIKLKIGDEIMCDAIIVDGNIEVNESMLTGESDNISKNIDDTILAGSFVTSGLAMAKIIHVGKDNYISHVLSNIKKEKHQPSKIRDTLNKIIKTITIIILPLGVALFLKQYLISGIAFNDAIIQTVASVVGMIPEGLVLLTSVALSIGCLNLSYQHTLVQEMYSLETLARVNVLCLDKTGTLTNGKMKVHEIINLNNNIENIIANIYHSFMTSNMTSEAIKKYYKKYDSIYIDEIYEFSSSKKYSGAKIGNNIYKIGAYNYLLEPTKEITEFIHKYTSNGYRVLTVTENDKLIGFIVLEDELRENVKDTISFFKDNDVELKIISGDDPDTVSSIAFRAGVDNYEMILDCKDIDDEELKEKVLTHTIFGRVSPDQKCLMIKTLKENGYTTGMVGDGVNDAMALKESDFSISFLSAIDSARNIANVILMDDDFSHMPKIVNEGRRVINNINRTSTLFLSKTALSILLTIATIFILKEYPFVPIQLTLLSTVSIGIPSFILSLEPDYSIYQGSFAKNIFTRAIPSAISIVITGFFLEILVNYHLIDSEAINTIYTIFTYTIFISNIIYISKPLNILRASLIAFSITAFIISYFIFTDIFYFSFLTTKEIIITIILIVISNISLYLINKIDIQKLISIKKGD